MKSLAISSMGISPWPCSDAQPEEESGVAGEGEDSAVKVGVSSSLLCDTWRGAQQLSWHAALLQMPGEPCHAGAEKPGRSETSSGAGILMSSRCGRLGRFLAMPHGG